MAFAVLEPLAAGLIAPCAACCPQCKRQGSVVLTPQRTPQCCPPCLRGAPLAVCPRVPPQQPQVSWHVVTARVRHAVSAVFTPAAPATVAQLPPMSSGGTGRCAGSEALCGRICVSVDADSISRIPRWPPSVQSGLVGGCGPCPRPLSGLPSRRCPHRRCNDASASARVESGVRR